MKNVALMPPHDSHFTHLDGLRGLAALYVVLHHSFLGVSSLLPEHWSKYLAWAWNGQIAVQVFIVLSGYCLMMPVAKTGLLRGGWLGFIRRRARRILPPYYAALILALATLALVPGLNDAARQEVDPTLPAFTFGAIASHLLLIQDFSKDWISKISGPMWTISQEWQIYFVFAIVLLPVWRRLGMVAVISIALVTSLALRNFPWHDFRYAAPQFLLLFASGMGAATVHFKGGDTRRICADNRPWGRAALATWAIYVAYMLHLPDQMNFGSMRMAIIEAVAMTCTLLFCTAAIGRGEESRWFLRFLRSRPAVLLGSFSYSLYLTHSTVLIVLDAYVPLASVPAIWVLPVHLLMAAVTTLVFAYLFYLCFERPFVRLAVAQGSAICTARPG